MSTAKSTSSRTSPWRADCKMPSFSRLASDVDVDVCIVGAGIAGLTTAYLLTKAGQRVALLDDGPLASGMTSMTTAHLSNAIDDRFVNILKWHGAEGARLAAESHGAAIDAIERIAAELGADCDFHRVDGYLFAADPSDEGLLHEELDAAHRAGVDAHFVDRAPLADFDTGACICFPRQARFHPLKYLGAMAERIARDGGRIYSHSHVDRVETADAVAAKIGDWEVRARSLVIATNSPINDMFVLHTKQSPYMTYAIGAVVPKGSVRDALYWDTLRTYHYVRLQEGDNHDLLIVGGEDQKSGQAEDADDRHRRLVAWARQRFPALGEIAFTWGGQCMETIDGLAFIGRNPADNPNVYVATGDSGMGMTHGTIAGLLIADLVLGRENPWQDLYDPTRKTVSAAGAFVKENVNVALQYADWLTPGEVASVDDVAPGDGAVLRRGMSKVAAYRNAKGELTELSAVCPHLGCIVSWNKAEATWDCPCHGSRFQAEGRVINGPANKDLPRVDGNER